MASAQKRNGSSRKDSERAKTRNSTSANEIESGALSVSRREHPCCIEKAETIAGKRDSQPSASAYRVCYGDIGNSKKGFSIYRRYDINSDKTPSPADYSDNNHLGNFGPKYSLGAKIPEYVEECPGPGSYIPHWEASASFKESPAYSLRARVGPAVFPTLAVDGYNESPGALAYFPQMEKSEVGATLKGRHKITKVIKTPGPGSYILSNETLGGPQFTMVPKDEFDPERDIARRPGPASYDTASSSVMALSHCSSPKYSLCARNDRSSAATPSPGPVYLPTIYTVASNCSPRVAIKSRHEPIGLKSIAAAPGPADYNPIFDAKKVETEKKSRTTAAESHKVPVNKLEKEIPTYPGPADYDSIQAMKKTLARAPAFSLGVRLRSCFGDSAPAAPTKNGNEGDDISSHSSASDKRASSGMARDAKFYRLENALKTAPAVPEGKKKVYRASLLPSSRSANSSFSARAASMKGRQSDAVLVFPTLRLDTLRV